MRLGGLDGLLGMLLAILVGVLGSATLDLFWTYDDPFLLRWAEEHDVMQAFLDPVATRNLPFRLLTPLLFASFELDLALFGREPVAFYGHQLLALALAAVLLYGVLRLWLSPLYAGCAGLLFLLGPPTVSWFHQLMTRHYVEGLVWAVAATLGFVVALRRDRWLWQIPAAGATALAFCAKEIYVPLPLLLLALPEGTWRRRLWHLVPHGVVWAAYPIWRWMLLGTLLGGYGWVSRPPEWPGLGLELPGKLARVMVGESLAWGLGMLLPVVLLTAWAAWAHGAGLRLLAVALASTLLPLLPAAERLEPRVVVLPWLVWAVGAAFGLREVSTRGSPRWAGGIAAGLLLLLIPAHRVTWTSEHAAMERMSAEARAFLAELDAGDLLAWPSTPRGTLEELARRRRSLGRPAAGWFDDELYLCLREPLPARVLTWDPARWAVLDVTRNVLSRRETFCSRVRRRSPMDVVLEHRDRTLSWCLGPWREGRWFLITGRGRSRYEVPREAAFFLGDAEGLRLWVRYDSPQGWTTYSPELVFPFDRASRLAWERGGAPELQR